LTASIGYSDQGCRVSSLDPTYGSSPRFRADESFELLLRIDKVLASPEVMRDLRRS
jgi:hypothetical protein